MSREMGEVSSAVRSGDKARLGQTVGVQRKTIVKKKSSRRELGGIEGETVGRRRIADEEQPLPPAKRRRTLPLASTSRQTRGLYETDVATTVPPWLAHQLHNPARDDSLSTIYEAPVTPPTHFALPPSPLLPRFYSNSKSNSNSNLAQAQSFDRSVPPSHAVPATRPWQLSGNDSNTNFADFTFSTAEPLPISTKKQHFSHHEPRISLQDFDPLPYKDYSTDFPRPPTASPSFANATSTQPSRPPSRTPYEMESEYNAVPAFEEAARNHSPSTFLLSKKFRSSSQVTPPMSPDRFLWRPPRRALSPTPEARERERRLAESRKRSQQKMANTSHTALESFKRDLSTKHDRFRAALSSNLPSIAESGFSSRPTASLPRPRQYPVHTAQQNPSNSIFVTPINRPLSYVPCSSPLSFSSVHNDENLPPPRFQDSLLEHFRTPQSHGGQTVEREGSIILGSSNGSSTLTANSLPSLPPSPTLRRRTPSLSMSSSMASGDGMGSPA
ncbi:hypothetical protein JCM5353_003314 [Sporobolomyces roseus]